MKVSKRERAKSMDVFLNVSVVSGNTANADRQYVDEDEETIVAGYTGQNSGTNVAVATEENHTTVLWVVVLVIVALIIGSIIYYTNNSSSAETPQIEKASYQDYFDK